jgi:hypothetical protein
MKNKIMDFTIPEKKVKSNKGLIGVIIERLKKNPIQTIFFAVMFIATFPFMVFLYCADRICEDED